MKCNIIINTASFNNIKSNQILKKLKSRIQDSENIFFPNKYLLTFKKNLY